MALVRNAPVTKEVRMFCANCKKEWKVSSEQEDIIFKAAETLSAVLKEVGIPVRYSPDNPLGYMRGGAGCCDNPEIYHYRYDGDPK